MNISKQIKDRLIDALITAFVFAAALAWKDTLTLTLNRLLPGDHTIWGSVIVTILITAIVIGLVYFILKGDHLADNNILFNDTDEDGNIPKLK